MRAVFGFSGCLCEHDWRGGRFTGECDSIWDPVSTVGTVSRSPFVLLLLLLAPLADRSCRKQRDNRCGSEWRICAVSSGTPDAFPGAIADPITVPVAGVMKPMGEDSTRVARSESMFESWRNSIYLRFYENLTRNDAVQSVDMILVLAGRMDRKHYGLELYRAELAPRLVLSVGRFEVSQMSQLDLECIDELKSLRDQTPPGERHFFVTLDASGARAEKSELRRRSTHGEALAFRRLLEHEVARKVMVISTDVHLRRVALTFAAVFRATPIHFFYCPVPVRLSRMAKYDWWRRPVDRWFVINEIIKLASYRIALSTPRWASRRLMRLTGWGRT
jgi:hypothetical protein